MSVISPSVDLFIFSSAVAIIPSWYILGRRHRPKARTRVAQPTPNASIPRPPYERVLTLLVHLHSLYIIYLLTIHWPPNIFSRLDIPLTTSNERIRSALLDDAGLGVDAVLPKALEDLLTKLGNAEVRLLYVRFGQRVIQDCVHCKSENQYALFALPGPALQYVREAILAGFLTAEYSGRSRWRTLGIIILVAACLGEAWAAVSAPVDIPRDGSPTFMVHDTLYLLRHLLFFMLPIFIQWLPTFPVIPPVTPLAIDTQKTLVSLQTRLQLLKYLEPAILRDEKLREASGSAWSQQKKVGGWIREDRGVWNVASQFIMKGKRREDGAKDGESALKEKIQQTVGELLKGMEPPVPPQPWH